MNEEQEKEPSKEEENPIIPNSSTAEYVDEAPGNQPTPESQTENNCKENKDHCKTIVNNQEGENSPATKANRIAVWAIIVNVILGAFTILLFRETQKANSISRAANDISKQALENARINDSVNRTKDSLTIDLANRSLQAQINSIQESKNQFSIENQPYLQIIYPGIDVMTIGKPLKIVFIIRNMGKYSVQIRNSKVLVTARTNVPEFNSLYESEKTRKINMENSFVIDQTPVISFSATDDLTKEWFNPLMAGTMYVYLWGEIEYINLANNKTRKYKFMVRMKTNKTYEILYNGNI